MPSHIVGLSLGPSSDFRGPKGLGKMGGGATYTGPVAAPPDYTAVLAAMTVDDWTKFLVDFEMAVEAKPTAQIRAYEAAVAGAPFDPYILRFGATAAELGATSKGMAPAQAVEPIAPPAPNRTARGLSPAVTAATKGRGYRFPLNAVNAFPLRNTLPAGGFSWPKNLDAVGMAYESLTAQVYAHKSSTRAPLGPSAALEMMDRANLPEEWREHEITGMIFASSAEELGLGFLKKIGKVFSNVAKQVGNVAADVTKRAVSITGQVMQTAAPVISSIPVLGPVVGAAAGGMGGQLVALSNSSLKSLAKDPGSLINATIEGAMKGGFPAPGQVPVAGSPPGYTSGMVSTGTPMHHAGGPNDPINFFRAHASAFAQYGPRFKEWSIVLRAQPPGTFMGKMGGTLYRIEKAATGLFQISTLSTGAVSSSITNQIREGMIAPVDPSLLVANRPALGAHGQTGAPTPYQMNPVGDSLPGGPGGSGVLGDKSTNSLLMMALSDAIAKQKDEEPASQIPMIVMAVAGGALFFFVMDKKRR